MSDQPSLFDTDTRVKELEADLKAAYKEQSRLNDLYARYRKEAAELTDRTRAALRKEAWDAVNSTDTFNQPLITEIKWLRSHINTTGRALHRQFGHTDGAQCDCLGCELIIATDLREPGAVPDGELGPRTDLQQRLIESDNERDRYRDLLAMHKGMNREGTNR